MAFTGNIMTKLHEYKRALKRYLNPQERDLKIQTLGLDRRSIREANDIELFQKAQMVVADIRSWIEHQQESTVAYSGIEEYCTHLIQFLNDYHIETDLNGKQKVLHTQQLVSRAVVNIIQILALSSENVLGKRTAQLDSYLQVVARYGNKEQKDTIIEALKSHTERHQKTISPLSTSFHRYMQTKFVSLNEYAG